MDEKMKVIELTPRQAQVLICLAEDMSSKQIFRQFNISTRTVMAHTLAIKAAFNAYTRTGALAAAVKCGTLRWDDEHEQWICAQRQGKA